LELHWELARAHLARHENGQAIVRCQIVRDKPGGAVFGRACAAEAWLSTLRASESHTEVKEARKLGNIPPRVEYSLHTSEGIAYTLELKYQEAESELEAAIKLDPNALPAHVALGRLLVQEGKDGSVHLRRAVELAPNNADALYELARTLPKGPEATALLNRAVAERPSFAAAHRLIATIELSAGHLVLAKKAADTALRIDPSDIASHLVTGDVALAENRLDEALREGQAALTLVANSAAARQLMADAYAKKGEIDLALENYQAAYGGDHSNPASLVNASVACLASGRPTSAKAFGEKATQEFPDWGPAWVAYGDALAANQDNAGAKNAYDRARRAQGPVDSASLDRKIGALK
jgi:tetratricopeptide (TPR) repeat protein